MTLLGIDISGWQTGLDLAAVPADFVIVKATGGNGFVSAGYPYQYQRAKALGKRRGLYHFAREDGWQGSAEDEADHFLRTIEPEYDHQTIIFLDWEGDNTWDTGYALTWLRQVEAALGVKPVVYMNDSVEDSFDWSRVASEGYPLWLAAYPGANLTNGYEIPSRPGTTHWTDPVMWQFTSRGTLPGWPKFLDLNVFYGDGPSWDALCGGRQLLIPGVPDLHLP